MSHGVLLAVVLVQLIIQGTYRPRRTVTFYRIESECLAGFHVHPQRQKKMFSLQERLVYLFSIMGGNESRVEQHDSTTDDSDDWKSRVEVKPSKQLVARLEQLQRSKDGTNVLETNTGSFAETSALEEDQRQQENERGIAMQREAEVYARGVRREEVSVAILIAHA